LFEYDTHTNSFFIHTFAQVFTCLGKWEDENKQLQMYAGSSTGQVYKMWSGIDDDGTPIDGEIMSHNYAFGEPQRVKAIHTIAAFHSPAAEMTINHYLDNGNPINMGQLTNTMTTKQFPSEKSNNYLWRFQIATRSTASKKPIFWGFTLEVDAGTERILKIDK
jgi:hypothetical protein